MTDSQKETLARLKTLSKQVNPDDLDTVYPQPETLLEEEYLLPIQYMDDLRSASEALVNDSLSVYAVGSEEDSFGKRKMIFDRVYGPADLDRAVEYCDSRQNWEWDWVVWEAPLGGDWIMWKEIHRIPRTTK